MKKSNGVLAKAFRVEINARDLTIKEVAFLIHRAPRTVYMVLEGEKVSDRTIAQLERVFPEVFA